MKRYGIFPIIGDGSQNNPYRASVDDVETANKSAVIPTDQNGDPVWNFAFCIFGTLNLTTVQQLTNSKVFPDYPLDGQMSGMEAAVRNALKSDVEAYDVDGQGTHFTVDLSDLTVSYRDVLLSIYQQFDPLLTSANFNHFDVAEPSE